MCTGEIRQQRDKSKLLITLPHRTKSLVLIVGLPFTVPMEDSCLLSSLPWREDFWRLHLELGMKRKKEHG